ncbi:ABC transporter ATP-binding protein [Acidobacteriota bacterium]
MSEDSSIVEATDLKKDFKLGETVVHAVRGVSFKIKRGGLCALVGPSGSGKTTILDMIGCLSSPSSGRIRIDKEDPSVFSDSKLSWFRAENIGFIFQTFNLIPVLSVFENVAYPLTLAKVPSQSVRERVTDILGSVGLGKYLKHRPNELSGGQRQRVAVARALVKKPKIILADEPTANLDSKTGALILDLMRELNDKMDTTIIFATHDKLVMDRVDEMLMLRDGKLMKDEEKT